MARFTLLLDQKSGPLVVFAEFSPWAWRSGGVCAPLFLRVGASMRVAINSPAERKRQK